MKTDHKKPRRSFSFDPSIVPLALKDRFTSEQWQTLPVDERQEKGRRLFELYLGKPMLRDRRLGRAKWAPGGFYELGLAELELHQIEQKAASTDPRIKLASDKVDGLRAKLTDELEEIERLEAEDEFFAEAARYTANQGLTLAEYIRKCRDIELSFYRAQVAGQAGDMKQAANQAFDGICQLADWIGFDPVEMLLTAANSPEPRPHA